MSVSSAETGECSSPTRKLFTGMKFHVFKPSFAGDEGEQVVDLIWTNGGLTASKPNWRDVSIVVVGVPPSFPQDVVLSLVPREADPRVSRGVFNLVWTSGIVLGERPPRADQRKHIVRPEWVHECLRKGELLMQDRRYGGWDVRGSYDYREITFLPQPTPPPTYLTPQPRSSGPCSSGSKDDRRPLPLPKIVRHASDSTTGDCVATSETRAGAGVEPLRPDTPPVNKPARQTSACYVPRHCPPSPGLPPPNQPPTSAVLVTAATPSDRPTTPMKSSTAAVIMDHTQTTSQPDVGVAATSQSLLHPNRSLGSPLHSATSPSPSRIGATPPTGPRMHRPAIDDKAGSTELERERNKKTTTSTVATVVTANLVRSGSSTATQSSIGIPALSPTATSIKTTTTIDDFFDDVRKVAPSKTPWNPENIVIHSTKDFEKTKTDEAQIGAQHIAAPILATGQGGSFVTSPLAIGPVNGGAPTTASGLGTASQWYHRAQDPRLKRQEEQAESIQEIVCAAVPVSASISGPISEPRPIRTESSEQSHQTVSASVVPGLGVKDTPESLEVEIIDLTGPAPSTAPPRPVRSTPLSLTLPPPHRSLKLAVDAPSFSARGLVSTSHTQACAVETETVDRSHPEEVSLIRKHSLVSTPLPPSPGVTPLKDSLCRQAATPKAPPRASPPSQPATTVTQVVSQARSSKIFRPAGLLPSSFYLAVPEPYKTSLEILITSFGGGCITTAERATYIILGCAGSGGGVLSPADERLARMVENDPSRALLSQEWVNACIRAGLLVDLEPYRIVIGAMGTTSPLRTVVELLRPPTRPAESLGVTRGDHSVGSVYDQEVQLAGAGHEVEAPNRARHDEEAKANYQHFEEDEETWDDPAFLEELQAFADRDDGSDYEMSASEVMSDEEFECLGEELESAGRVGSAPLGLSYLGPDERKTVWAKDREVYDWMVRSLKAWDRVGSRKEFLKSLGSRCPFGRSCNSLFVLYRSHFERDVPGLKAVARPTIRRPRPQRRGKVYRTKNSGEVGARATRRMKAVGGAEAQAQAQAGAERNASAQRNKRGVWGVGVCVAKEDDDGDEEIPLAQWRKKKPRTTV